MSDVDGLFTQPAARAATELKGAVRITAPYTLGREHLLPALRQIALDHPGLMLDLWLSDQVADVVDEEIDIGVRLGMFRDQRLVARRTGRILEFSRDSDQGRCHISMSTIGVDTAQALTVRHREAGFGFVSAPVFGRPDAAAARKLFIMAAGADEHLNIAVPFLEQLSVSSGPILRRRVS